MTYPEHILVLFKCSSSCTPSSQKKKKKKESGTCTPFFDKGENNYEHGLSTSL